jgi:hypothetical protein
MRDPSNLPDDMRIAVTESKTVEEVVERLGLTSDHAYARVDISPEYAALFEQVIADFLPGFSDEEGGAIPLAAIKTIVERNYEDERRHWEGCNRSEKARHIFNTLARVKIWLKWLETGEAMAA